MFRKIMSEEDVHVIFNLINYVQLITIMILQNNSYMKYNLKI